MKGSTLKRGDTWTAYWSLSDPTTGKRKQYSKGGFRTKKLAQDHLTEVLPKVADGTFVAPRKLTVGEYLTETWLPSRRSANLRETTLAQYEVVVDKWIIPHVGGLQLRQLTPAILERFHDSLAAKGGRARKNGVRAGLGQRSVQRAAVTLKMALDHAVRNGVIGRNPYALLEHLPRVQDREMSWWAERESIAFLESVRSDRLAAAWSLFLVLGMRRGEVAGLRWQDVDLDAGTLRVVHTLVVGGDNRAKTSTPKTKAGRRTLQLDPNLVAGLRSHQRRQRRERMAARTVWTETGYVFVREDGEPFHPDHFSARFERLTSDAGLRRIRLHDARHSVASQQIASGTPTKVVQEVLGHANPAITERLYAHVMPGMKEGAIASLSARLLGGESAG